MVHGTMVNAAMQARTATLGIIRLRPCVPPESDSATIIRAKAGARVGLNRVARPVDRPPHGNQKPRAPLGVVEPDEEHEQHDQDQGGGALLSVPDDFEPEERGSHRQHDSRGEAGSAIEAQHRGQRGYQSDPQAGRQDSQV